MYKSEYETARIVSKFISFMGWIVFLIGVFVAVFVGTSESATSSYNSGVSFLATLPGIGISVAGLFLVAAGQVTRATVDNADHTREILRIIREKPDK